MLRKKRISKVNNDLKCLLNEDKVCQTEILIDNENINDIKEHYEAELKQKDEEYNSLLIKFYNLLKVDSYDMKIEYLKRRLITATEKDKYIYLNQINKLSNKK